MVGVYIYCNKTRTELGFSKYDRVPIIGEYARLSIGGNLHAYKVVNVIHNSNDAAHVYVDTYDEFK